MGRRLPERSSDNIARFCAENTMVVGGPRSRAKSSLRPGSALRWPGRLCLIVYLPFASHSVTRYTPGLYRTSLCDENPKRMIAVAIRIIVWMSVRGSMLTVAIRIIVLTIVLVVRSQCLPCFCSAYVYIVRATADSASFCCCTMFTP